MTNEQALSWFQQVLDGSSRRPGDIRLLRESGVATLIIDNASARNALHVGMMQDLALAVEQLEANPPGLVLLRAAKPGAFCAGGHLGDVRTSLNSSEMGEQMALAMSAVLNRLYDLPSLVVAVVEGPAIGGGAELAMAADLRLILPGGYLHFVQARLGVVCGWGGAGRLVSTCGRGNAVRALLGVERLTGALCEQMGIGLAVDPDGLARWLEHLERLSADVLSALKNQVRSGQPVYDATGVVDQARCFANVWAGPAHREALAKLSI